MVELPRLRRTRDPAVPGLVRTNVMRLRQELNGDTDNPASS